MGTPHKKWIFILILMFWANACMLLDDIPQTDQKTLAEVSSSDANIEAAIRYDFVAKRLRKYDSPCYNRRQTSIENIVLEVRAPGQDKPWTLRLMNQRNKNSERPFKDLDAQLRGSPRGDRFAYKIGEGPWQLVHVMPSVGLIQAPEGSLGGEPKDWSNIPTISQQALELFEAHGQSQGIYSSLNRGLMFRHLRSTLSEEELVAVLSKLASAEVILDTGWHEAAKGLSSGAKQELGDNLVEAATKPDASPYLIDRAAPYMTFEAPEQQVLAHRAPGLLLQHEQLAGWSERSARIYLLAFSRQDRRAASEEACALLTKGWSQEKYRYAGRIGRVSLLTAIGLSPEPPCPILSKLLPEDACANGASKPDGERFSDEELQAILVEEAAKPPSDKVRANIDGRFVMAAMRGKNMALPEPFTKPCAPRTAGDAPDTPSTNTPAPETKERE